MPVALLQEVDEAIISQAYPIFEIKETKQLLPEYFDDVVYPFRI